jgi:HSP20 family protein
MTTPRTCSRRYETMVMRFDPFRELDRLTQPFRGDARGPRVMPMDAYRRGDRFVVHFDVPGVAPDSIELTVEENVLNVSAERRWAAQREDEVIVNERPEGKFSRQLFLGETLDTANISADYDQGVLTVTIPVAERAKPRRVQISGSPGGGRQSIDTESRES